MGERRAAGHLTGFGPAMHGPLCFAYSVHPWLANEQPSSGVLDSADDDIKRSELGQLGFGAAPASSCAACGSFIATQPFAEPRMARTTHEQHGL